MLETDTSDRVVLEMSRYQLVRCGWGATLPATLYPAIYMWPTAIY
jgi:hypothetical protein